MKFNSNWLLGASFPFDVAAIILFIAGKTILGDVFLIIGTALYLTGFFLARKESKAQEVQNTATAEETSEEQVSAEQTSEEQES